MEVLSMFTSAVFGKRGCNSTPPPPGRDSLDNRLTAGLRRLAAGGAALVALTGLPAAPPAVAQTPRCTPAGYTGTLPAVTYDGPTTEISCNTLTGGLEMTLGPGFTMGTEATPLEVRAIYVDADGDGGEDIVVMGSGTIYTKKSGFYLKRDGTGLLKLEFTKGSIVAEGDSEGIGIYLRHKGEAGEEAKGIHISSGADIDLSAHTDNGKRGIHATTTGADPTAVIPIEIRVTGGTIDVSDPPGSSVGGIAVRAEQFAKGDIAVTVEKAAMLGTKDAVAGDAGIEAWLRPRSEGDIVITHRGGIHAATGIVAGNETASSEKGDITITTEAGSTITTNEQGISTSVDEAASTSDITITHNGEIDADGTGISVTNKGKGDVTVTTGKDSKVTGGDDEYGILVGIESENEGNITITHNGEIDADGTGISVTNKGKGDVTVTTGKDSKVTGGDDEYGILVEIESENEGNITITHNGEIDADGTGISVTNKGKGDVTVTTGKDSKVTGGDDEYGILVEIESENEGNITITHRGAIHGGHGIYLSNYATSDETGDITITTEAGSAIMTEGAGNDGIFAFIDKGTGDITITHKGAIDAGRIGIFTYTNGKGSVTVATGADSRISARGDAASSSGINASVRGSVAAGDVTVTHGGEITAEDEGIYASNRNTGGTGTLSVTTSEGSKVTAEKQGILVRHDGTGTFAVKARGAVRGGDADDDGMKYAGVHIQVKKDDITAGKGGTIAVGSRAHVHALSGDAVRADGHAGPVKIVLELDKDGLTGHLEGRILNPEEERKKGEETTTAQAELTFHTRAGTDDDAPLTRLTADDDVKGIVYRRRVSDGISDEVIKAQLQTTLAENGKPAWYEFIDLPSVQRLYRDRARLYEALPSVLLGLNARPWVGTGMCEGGARAEVFMSDGERMAESSTTAAGWKKQALGWDMKRRVVEAGYNFPADGSLCVGFSAGRRTVKADVMRGGGIKAEATGGAVTLGWRPDGGVDVSWRLSYSRLHDIELSPAGGGAVIAAPGGGGVSVSVAAGKRMEFQGMQVTPRAGFEFSSVETGGFTEPAALEGAGEVSDVRAGSLKGTMGARIDMAAGEAGTIWAAADVEHDFKGGTDITVTGAVLEAEMKPTRGRLGLGGEFRLSDMMTVSGGAYYAAGLSI